MGAPGMYRANAPSARYGYPGQRYANRGGDDRGRDHFRRPYISGWRTLYPYGYGPAIWPGYPGFLDYDDYDDDSSAGYNDQNGGYLNPDYNSYDNGDGGYDMPPPQQWPSLGPYAPSSGHETTSMGTDRGVTLIFKDGRAPEQVHNYVLTQTYIFVGDARGNTISLDKLDIPATEKANQDAGVDFRLPQSSD
jgi:hypothetical protein